MGGPLELPRSLSGEFEVYYALAILRMKDQNGNS